MFLASRQHGTIEPKGALRSGLPRRRILARVRDGHDRDLIRALVVALHQQVLRPSQWANPMAVVRQGVQFGRCGNARQRLGDRVFKSAGRLRARASYQAMASSKSASARRSSRTLATGGPP